MKSTKLHEGLFLLFPTNPDHPQWSNLHVLEGTESSYMPSVSFRLSCGVLARIGRNIKGKGKVTPKQAYVALRGPGG
jgi:hypothetical protein